MTLTPDASPLVLAERYRLDERVGAGSMGTVWRATDQLLGRTVAVKQLLFLPGTPGFDIRGHEEAKQRILREGRLAARLQHPHTIAVFDAVLHDDAPWLVMEYMPSRTLSALLLSEAPIDPARIAAIGWQIADGLAAAHAAGIVHRDIKPANVLIGDDSKVKITDFGVSRAADDVQLTRTGMIAGTPAYLAPEIARGQAPTPASDVFALGATLYAAVEGEPPFGLDDNAFALLYKVGRGDVRRPERAGPLTDTLMRMLRKEPRERPTAALARDLLAALVGGQSPDELLAGPSAARRSSALSAAGAAATTGRSARGLRPAKRVKGSKGPAKGSKGPAKRAEEGPKAPLTGARGPANGSPGPSRTALDEPPDGRPAGAGGDTKVDLSAPPGTLNPAPGMLAAAAPSAGPSAAPRGRAKWRLWAAVAVVAVALGAGAALLVPGLGARTGLGPATSQTPAAAGAAGGSNDATAPVHGKPTPAQLEGFVRQYYALLPGQPQVAWARLGQAARQASDGFDSYRRFYASLQAVNFADGPTAVDGRTVRATLRFEPTHGSTTTERYQFTVVPGPDGRLVMTSFARL
jgi:eukaryotic-like serine/threonine-protein kinase